MAALVLAVTGTEVVLVALVLGGLVGVYALLLRRLNAFEQRAAHLELTVDALAQARHEASSSTAAAVVAAPAPPAVDLAPIDARFDRIALQLEEFAQESLRASTALTQQIRQVQLAQDRAPGDRPRAWTVREVVERHLKERGFTSVRLLAGGDSPATQPTRVGVEAAKSGIWHKGYAIVDANRVTEDKLTSSHEVFP